MMEVVLNGLRDFSCKSSRFECAVTGGQWRDVPAAEGCSRARRGAGEAQGRLDIESALAWLRTELMEMRSQDQALIRQLMELNSGIQELKQELSEEELTEEEEEASGEGEGSEWETESSHSSRYSSSGEESYPASPARLHTRAPNKRRVIRRSSVP